MKRHMPLVALLGLVWGCEQPITPDVKLYRPGRKLLLVLRTEIDMTTDESPDHKETAVHTRGPDSRIVERKETKNRSIEWMQMELPLEVKPADAAGRRIPQHPERGMPRRVSHMTVTGTLRFNLDRAEVIDLRLASTPYFLKAEDRRWLAVKFVDSVQLTRPND